MTHTTAQGVPSSDHSKPDSDKKTEVQVQEPSPPATVDSKMDKIEDEGAIKEEEEEEERMDTDEYPSNKRPKLGEDGATASREEEDNKMEQ